MSTNRNAATSSSDTNPIVLFGFEKASNKPSESGFCQKVESYLRATSTSYKLESSTPFMAPKGKLPYITHAGEKVADSTFILRYLVDSGLSRNLDAELTAVQRAESGAWKVYMEEMLYPCVCYERWMIKENYDTLLQTTFAAIPWLVRPFIAAWFYRRVSQGLYGQGVGRHSVEEVKSLLRGAVDDFAARLEGHTYFHDTARATGIDVIVYAFLSNALDCRANPYYAELILSKSSLVRFVLTLTEQLFPEYESLHALVSKERPM